MNNRHIGILIVVLICTLSFTSLSFADDTEIRIIQGAVYINDQPDTNQIENGLTIRFDIGENRSNETTTREYYPDDDLNYGKGFFSIPQGETISFFIEIDSVFIEPDEISIDGNRVSGNMMTMESETIYHVNLYINEDAAYNPIPGNQSKNRDIDQILSWSFDETGKDDIIHHIYFGTNRTPPYLANTSNTSFHPGNLSYDVTYYWRINTSTDDGWYESETWWFSTRKNPKPIADAGGDYTGTVDEAITFNASNSRDDKKITGYRWDWKDDGSWDTEWMNSSTTTHTYAQGFEGTVKLQVRDADDNMDTDVASVTIESLNNPPVLDPIEGPSRVPANTSITINVTATDPDNDQITYKIDWDDGSIQSTKRGISGITVSESHIYTIPGWYTITVTASDSSNAQDSETWFIVIEEEQDTNKEDTSDSGGGFPWLIVIIIIVVIAIGGVLFYLYQNDKLPISRIQKEQTGAKQNTSLKDSIFQLFQKNKQNNNPQSNQQDLSMKTPTQASIPQPIQTEPSSADMNGATTFSQLNQESKKDTPNSKNSDDEDEQLGEFKRL